MFDAVEQAKIALGVKSDLDMSRALGVAASAIGGYRRRNVVPLEQCVKIARQTGVSLDWLVLGEGEQKPGNSKAAPSATDSYLTKARFALEQRASHTCASTENDTSTSSVDRAKIALGVKSDYELAHRLNVTPSSVGGYRRRNNTVPLEQCIKIADQTGVSLDWLVLGKDGQKTGGTEGAPSAASSGMDNGTAGVSFIPLYGTTVSAGRGALSDIGVVIGQVPFDSNLLSAYNLNTDNCACFSVAGDSMSPYLADGDIVLASLTQQCGDGVFIVRIGNELHIKRLQYLTNGSLRISSDNPLYHAEVLNPTDNGKYPLDIVATCRIRVGRVF